VAQRGGGLPGFEDLEVIRVQAGLSVVRFCDLLGMPRATWYRWRAAVTGGAARPGKGPWPAPVVDRIEPLAAKHAEQWAAWGHRKIWGLLTADGVAASQASVRRAMARRGLLQPVGYQAERRQLAQARRAVFLDPPTRRNRVWQTDFSELESLAGGIWRMSGVVDYWAKLCLTCPVTTTQGTRDAVAALEAAIDQAETLLGRELLQDCVDHHTGELTPVVVVTDNGPAYRSVGFARFIASRPELTHVRTRHRSPQTNGVVERFYQAIKYEHLYRHQIPDGLALAQEVEAYLTIYNTIRPHEAIGFATPLSRYLQAPSVPSGANLQAPATVSDS
jgi:transposase InsO family protein